MPDPITGVAGIEIGGIIAPRLRNRREIAFNFLPGRPEQRSDQVFFPLPGSDTGKATHAGAAQNLHKYSLGLVVEGMSSGELARRSAVYQSGKPPVPELARSRFKAQFVLPRMRRD